MFISKNSKSPFYQLTYINNGKRTTVSTKSKSLKGANTFMIDFVRNEKMLVQKTKNISLVDFKEDYLKNIRPVKSRNYVRSIESSFKMLLRFNDNINLNKLDVRTLDQFISHYYKISPHSAALYYRTLKAAFSKAVLWNYLTENPLKKIKAPKIKKSFPVIISEDQLQMIINATQEKFLQTLFYAAFYTGMRLGEMVSIRWNWIDFENKIITVKCTSEFSPKSKKERIIPMTEKLYMALLNFKANHFPDNENKLVFHRIKDVKLNEDYVSKKFKKAVKRCTLDNKIHFHSLRHSFASLLVQRGASLFVVKELLGHEELSTTQIYSHLQQKNLRDAVNLF